MYEVKSRVGMSHTAENGTIKLSSILDTLQDCFCFDVEEEKTFSNYVHSHSLAVFVAFQQIDILRYPHYGENIVTKSWTFKLERFRGTRNTVIFDENGEVLIATYGIGVFVDLTTGLPARTIPKEILDSVRCDPQLSMDYLPRRIALPKATEATVMPPYHTKKYQVDSNGHINNARYMDMALEYLPKDFSVKRMVFQYKNPAKYGDVIYPKVYCESRDNLFMTLDNSQGESDVLVAFSQKI